MSSTKYKRILLKVSGEALGEKTAAGDGFGLDFVKVNEVCAAIKECVNIGVQVGLVIGGGNFWRGVKNGSGKMQRSHAILAVSRMDFMETAWPQTVLLVMVV